MTFLLATENIGKLREMRELLAPLGYELVLPADFGLVLDVEETGETFEENARLKAKIYCAAIGIPSIADDSGLCVDALGGEPGVHSKRYGGGGLSDGELCELLLKNVESTEQRAAKFVSVIVCAFPDGGELVATGECFGEIARERRGDGGFGYDPVFYLPQLGKTMAQLTPEEKNSISHRGNALREFAAKLTEYTTMNDERNLK